MADIAFLLLIFFLVVTTMQNEKGIISKLPPPDVNTESGLIHDRNVLEVLINAKDALLVEGEPFNINRLKEMTIKHVNNFDKLPNHSVHPKKSGGVRAKRQRHFLCGLPKRT